MFWVADEVDFLVVAAAALGAIHHFPRHGVDMVRVLSLWHYWRRCSRPKCLATHFL